MIEEEVALQSPTKSEVVQALEVLQTSRVFVMKWGMKCEKINIGCFLSS